MDYPFLAVLWNPLDPAQAPVATQFLGAIRLQPWRIVIERDGMTVYTQSSPIPYLAAQPLRNARGVVLGVLFDRNTNQRPSTQEIREDPLFAEPGLETVHNLARHYWGGYVGLLAGPRGDWCVFRDCSGMIPCYYTAVRGVTLISSDARNFFSFTRLPDQPGPPVPIEINWRYIAGFLAHSQLQIRETGLKNIYELLAGETLYIRRGRHCIETTWNPSAFAAFDSRETLEARCDALRTTAQACIDAWASVHDWVVHSLSGGFDSSLVLALLRHSPTRPHVVCINRYSTGPGEDEREYARIAARAADTPLVEWPWNFGNQALDPSLLQLPYSAKPSIPALLSPLEANFFTALRAAHPFDAIWNGEGGDHLFLAMATELIVTDFLRAKGLRPRLLDILCDATRLTGRSIPGLALRAIRFSNPATVRHPEFPPLTHSLLSPTCCHREDLCTYIQHPWSSSKDDLLPGKRRQITLLADVLHRLRPLPGTQQSVELQPLLSQPLIEYCIGIPSYDLLHGGRTRGLARRAFANNLPAEIIKRETKGQTTHHLLGLMRRSLPFLSGILRDGTLAQQNLLNGPALEPLLNETQSVSAEKLFALLSCVAAEVWVRSWCNAGIPPQTSLRLQREPSRSTNL